VTQKTHPPEGEGSTTAVDVARIAPHRAIDGALGDRIQRPSSIAERALDVDDDEIALESDVARAIDEG